MFQFAFCFSCLDTLLYTHRLFTVTLTSTIRIEVTNLHNTIHTHTRTHPFNGPLSRTTQMSQYQKGKTNLDFTEARNSKWQWHQLGRMQVCTSLQTDNHASAPPLSFLQVACPSCCPTNSVKALKALIYIIQYIQKFAICCTKSARSAHKLLTISG